MAIRLGYSQQLVFRSVISSLEIDLLQVDWIKKDSPDHPLCLFQIIPDVICIFCDVEMWTLIFRRATSKMMHLGLFLVGSERGAIRRWHRDFLQSAFHKQRDNKTLRYSTPGSLQACMIMDGKSLLRWSSNGLFIPEPFSCLHFFQKILSDIPTICHKVVNVRCPGQPSREDQFRGTSFCSVTPWRFSTPTSNSWIFLLHDKCEAAQNSKDPSPLPVGGRRYNPLS